MSARTSTTPDSTDALAIKQRIAEASSRATALEQERSALEEVELTSKSDERRSMQMIARAEDECDDLETQLEANESRHEQLAGELAEARRELKVLEETVSVLEQSVARLEVQARKLAQDCAAMTRQVAQAQQRMRTGVGSVLRMDHKLASGDLG